MFLCLIFTYTFSSVLTCENIALNKPTWQQNADARFDWRADRVVDGKYSDLSADGGQCTISTFGKNKTEWRVDLREVSNIYCIFLQYRTDNLPWDKNNHYTQYFLGFSVYISNTTNKEDGMLCFRDTSYTRATIPNPVNLICPYNGRYVIYYNNRTHRPYPDGYSYFADADLCEVEVYGCPTRCASQLNCSLQCPHNNQGDHYNIVDSSGFNCTPGYKEDTSHGQSSDSTVDIQASVPIYTLAALLCVSVIANIILIIKIRRIKDARLHDKQGVLDTHNLSTTLSTTDSGSAYQALNGIPMSSTYESLSGI